MCVCMYISHKGWMLVFLMLFKEKLNYKNQYILSEAFTYLYEMQNILDISDASGEVSALI